ncbi:linear gramicidin synthase subunit D [bacterium BMS3Bbin14]|nr:linear gramicidin synthase subunit D [bacterium BMS3Bbin14]
MYPEKIIRTVGDLIIHAAGKSPDKPAVLYKNDALTYAQVYEQSLRLARRLIRLGVGKGDRVCFYLEKRLEKVVSIFGISIAGGIFVPINRLAWAGQALHIIKNSEATVLITTFSRLASLKESLSGLLVVIVIDRPDDDTLAISCPVMSWEEVMDGNACAQPSSGVIANDVAAILYTSGSTGLPKGVVLNHLNIIAGAYAVSEYLKISTEDRILSILGFGFDYGLNQLISSFLQGAQLVLYDYLFPKDILTTVEKYNITGLAAVATTWIQLLQIPWGNAMNSLRYLTNSGASIPVPCVKELRTRIPAAELYLMYGLTEAFRSTYLPPEMVDQRPSSIGKAIPGEQILVLDENNQPVKPGETGELVHRGVLVAQGYWGEPELTAERFRKNPLQLEGMPIRETVVYSGDYVRMDGDGYLYFEGRRDEMIKSAGNRISPTEIEEILYNSHLVSAAVALGIPHEIYGQVILAVVSFSHGENGKSHTKDELLAYCQQNMPPPMVPREIEIWDKLPINSNGKHDRAKIKKEIYEKKGLFSRAPDSPHCQGLHP